MERTEKNKLPAYLDESLSFEERAADLVSRMTLEEKAAQLKNEAAAVPRLGVRAYNYWREALHGVARQGKATSFPTSLSMANTWNAALVRRAAEITAEEARGKNPITNLSYWSPTVNMARDPRWGRNEETYGEDPYLSGRMGSEFVKGMQGGDERYIKTIATVKHFVANNVEKERRMGTSVMSERTLRDYYGRVFQNIVEEAKPASAMSSYNATTVLRNGKPIYDYVPATANPYILKDLLRRNWGFTGYVTGDCGAFGDLNNTAAYKTVLFPNENIEDVPPSATITKGFLNGADTDCGYSASAGSVLDAVRRGYITEDQLNINVYNLFLQRMRTGEFDKNPKYRGVTADVLETPEHIAAAEEAAEQSWVLLKNDGILPLKKDIKRVALVGALADEVVLGDYSGSPEHTITPYEGIAAELKKTHGAKLEFLGGVTDSTRLLDLKNLELELRDGGARKIDLSGCEVSGAEIKDGRVLGVTRKTSVKISGVDFGGAVSVSADTETAAGGKIKLYYGFGGPQVAELKQDGEGRHSGAYTGEAGGYCGTADLYIEFEAETAEFSIDKYKAELDAADVIIAYAGTTLSDSAEFNDRSGIALPESQSHAAALTAAYPEKTVLALQTVGQIDVAPFESGARAILWTSYNGQTQGTALGKILTGAANPSGKLTTTWYTAADLEKMPVGTEGVLGDDGITRYYNNYEIRPDKNNDFPGRTYQYYTNEPVYPFGFGLSYTEFEYKNLRIAESESEITAEVDVTNVGGVSGMEAVQFYIEYPEGCGLPKIQLKGFDKLALGPGEIKTAKAVIKFSELRFFDEETQKTYVPIGNYKIYAAKNSADKTLCAEFSVTEGIEPRLKTVAALPDGIITRGLVGDEVEPTASFNLNLSAVLTDESFLELDGSNTEYKSADESVARVDADGTVLPGTREGVTLITASVTFGGETKSARVPVVNMPEFKASDADKADAAARLKAARNGLPDKAYSDKNIEKLDNILRDGLDKTSGAEKLDELRAELENALRAINSVEPDGLRRAYEITAPEIVGGMIKNSGKIRLSAIDENGNRADVKWRIENLGGSKRAEAEIDENDGMLTATANGLIRVRAINIEEMRRGEAVIYINLPIEGETADDGGGADLTAEHGGRRCAADTKSRPLEYRSIRLENLKRIRLRYSLGGAAAAAKFTASGLTVAEGILRPTGGGAEWSEAAFDADAAAIFKAAADENGLSSLTLIAGGANIDRFELIYEEPDDEHPHKVAAIEDGPNGAVTLYINYVGAGAPQKTMLTYGDAALRVCGRGALTITEPRSVDGEKYAVKLCGQTLIHTYREPKPSRRVIYSASDPAYEALFDKSGAVKLPEINGLTGYGPLKCHVRAEHGFELGGKAFKFTRDWQGAEGGESRACLFFTPEAPCEVTVIYDGGEDREQYIAQNGTRFASGLSKPTEKTAITARITDTSAPVYTYGGENNKSVYAVIVDYYGGEGAAERTVRSVITPSGFARIDKDRSGRSRILLSADGGAWSEVDLSMLGFDETPAINDLAVHKDRVYAGCGGGEVLIITDCPKCRARKKLCDFDIEKIEIADGNMILSGGGRREEISMTALGADQIRPDEAMTLIATGAAAIDVRERDIFESEPSRIDGAVNIPLSELEKITEMSRDRRIVFCCSRGIRSAEAVLRAKEMGFANVYYLI